MEGWKATVLVARDSHQSDHWLTVAFATSDLTARGVDSDAYRECFELPVGERLPVRRKERICLFRLDQLSCTILSPRIPPFLP